MGGPLTRLPRTALLGAGIVALLLVGGTAFALTRGGGAPTTAATPAGATTTAGGPAGATTAIAAPAAAPRCTAPRAPCGPLIYEAKLDAAGSGIRRLPGPPGRTADPNAIRTLDGAVQFTIPDNQGSGPGGGTPPLSINWGRQFPATLFAEMDVKVAPGSQLGLVCYVRQKNQTNVQLAAATFEESMELQYITYPAPGASQGQFVQPETIGTPVGISGFASGNKVTIGIAVQPQGGFTMFFNGQNVGQVTEPRAAAAGFGSPLAISVYGQSGTLTLTGFRVYQLAAP